MPHGEPLNTHAEQDAVQYVTEVTGFFLALRGAGVSLSPNDMALVLRWQEAGLPLNTVLRGLHRGSTQKRGASTRARASAPLTLRSLHKAVEKEVLACAPQRERRRTRTRRIHRPLLPPESLLPSETVQASGPAGPTDASSRPALSEPALRAFLDETRAQLELLRARSASLPEIQSVFLQTIQALEATGAAAGQPLLALLQLGRTFYERLWMALPALDREELDAELELLLQETESSGAVQARSEDEEAQALHPAVQSEPGPCRSRLTALSAERQWELRLRALRERFHLFEPETLMGIWEEHDSNA